MIYPHRHGPGTTHPAPIGTTFLGLSGMAHMDAPLLIFAAKEPCAPPVTEKELERTATGSENAQFVACKLGGSSTKPAVVHPEPPTISKPRRGIPIQRHSTRSPSRQSRNSYAPRSHAPASQSSPLRREVIQKLIDDTKPAPGSVFGLKPKSGEKIRALFFKYQAECIKLPALKPLRVYQGLASVAVVLSGGGISRRDRELAKRGPASTKLAATSTHLAKSTAIYAGRDVVDKSKDPSRNDNLQGLADHTRHVNKPDMPSDDWGNGPRNSGDAHNAPYPRPPSSAGSSLSEWSPPPTPTDIDTCFIHPDMHIEHPRCLDECSDFTTVDVGGALSATH